jgi:hypothetical protein
VYFAGEATDTMNLGYAHGAFLSGGVAANEII